MAKLPEQIFKYVGSDRIDILEKLLIRFTHLLLLMILLKCGFLLTVIRQKNLMKVLKQ
jgi:hypothetical protein